MTDRDEARRALWARYDAGELGAEELAIRLQRLDALADGADEAAVRVVLDGRVPLHRRRTARVAAGVALGVVAVAGLVGGAVALVGEDGGTSPEGGAWFEFQANAGGGFAVPLPAPEPCELPDRAVDLSGEVPANPALLSDPPFAPEGYDVRDDEAITPGEDRDLSMGVAAGSPAPVEIRGRTLVGDLTARVRAFRYDDPVAADEAGRSAAASACSNMEHYEVPDRPELYGTVVTGVIPDTVFVSAVVGDRSVVVAVESEGDVDEAKALAEQVAGAELDALRTPPPEGAPPPEPPPPAPPAPAFETTTIVVPG